MEIIPGEAVADGGAPSGLLDGGVAAPCQPLALAGGSDRDLPCQSLSLMAVCYDDCQRQTQAAREVRSGSIRAGRMISGLPSAPNHGVPFTLVDQVMVVATQQTAVRNPLLVVPTSIWSLLGLPSSLRQPVVQAERHTGMRDRRLPIPVLLPVMLLTSACGNGATPERAPTATPVDKASVGSVCSLSQLQVIGAHVSKLGNNVSVAAATVVNRTRSTCTASTSGPRLHTLTVTWSRGEAESIHLPTGWPVACRHPIVVAYMA
jgi:hypothetical protein